MGEETLALVTRAYEAGYEHGRSNAVLDKQYLFKQWLEGVA